MAELKKVVKKETKEEKVEGVQNSFTIDATVFREFITRAVGEKMCDGVSIIFDKNGAQADMQAMDNVVHMSSTLKSSAMKNFKGETFVIGIRSVKLITELLKTLDGEIRCIVTENFISINRNKDDVNDVVNYRLADKISGEAKGPDVSDWKTILKVKNSALVDFIKIADQVGSEDIIFEQKNGKFGIFAKSDSDTVQRIVNIDCPKIKGTYSMERIKTLLGLFSGDSEVQFRFSEEENFPIVMEITTPTEQYVYIMAPRTEEDEE